MNTNAIRLILVFYFLLSGETTMSETAASQAGPEMIVPIAIEKSFLNGKGLTDGDPGEFDDEGIEREEDSQATFRQHNFHTGKIMVSVYESDPATVQIDGSLYDEYVYILEGRLILTPEGGDSYEFTVGDSLVVPKGYKGEWRMPEPYRELIIIDTEFMQGAQAAE